MDSTTLLMTFIMVMLHTSSGEVVTVGQQSIEPVTSYLATGANKVFLYSQNTFSQDAVITKLSGWFLSNEPVFFQVWRPVDEDNKSYKLVRSHLVNPSSTGQREDISLEEDDYMCAQSGDSVGFMNNNTNGPIGYKYVKPSGMLHFTHQTATDKPKKDDTVTFTSSPYPYTFQFSVEADTGLTCEQESEEEVDSTTAQPTSDQNTTGEAGDNSTTPEPNAGQNTSGVTSMIPGLCSILILFVITTTVAILTT